MQATNEPAASPGQMELFPTAVRASMAAGPDSLRLTAPVEIAAAAAGEGKRPTFSIVGYTGAVMRPMGWGDQVILDLAGLKPAHQQIPALHNHDGDRIVGQTDRIEVGTDVRLDGTFTGDNEHAREVTSQAKNGFRWQASIGANVDRREFLEAGKTATVNGRQVSGPLVIAREATILEISFVPIGADNRTSATVAASHPPGTQNGALSMFEQWLQAKGIDPTGLSDAVRSTLQASHDAEQALKASASAPPPTPQAPPVVPPPAESQGRLEGIFAEARQEADRQAKITEITASAVRDRPMMLDTLERMSRTAIEAKDTTVQDFKLAVLEATSNVAPAGGFAVHTRDRKVGGKMVEAALCMAGGLDQIEKHFDEQTLNATADHYPNGLGLRDSLVIGARENGSAGHFTGNDPRPLLEAAFRPHIQAQGWSTLSLPGIFANTANKFLVAGFDTVEDTWRSISARRSVRDFKQVNTYSLTGGFMYEKVGPGGELKHATAGEMTYSNQVETYGRMFAIDRTDLINDDLGALTQIPRKLGRGAALKLNDVFWTVFMNNGSFFTTARGNALEGATPGTNDSRLNLEGLTRGSTAFMDQTDEDGYPTAITPSILLVPNALAVTAANLMNSTQIAGDTTASTLTLASNPFAGRFRVVQSSYLSNASYTGNSTTAWYLLANPNDLPVIEVAFLNGRERPMVENADADFNSLGIQFRGFFDFGCSLQEYRAGLRAKGAAG